MKIKQIIVLVVMLFSVTFFAGCWSAPDEGTVEIQTIYGEYSRTIRPSDGGVWTVWTRGDQEYPVNLRAKQMNVTVNGTSKDNAGLSLVVSVSYSVPDFDNNVFQYFKKFGTTEEERKQRFEAQAMNAVASAGQKAINKHDAYTLLANTTAVQDELRASLTPLFANEYYVKLDDVQIPNRPDFIDDRIETAGSGVVAAKKKQEEEEALKNAAETRNKRLVIEAQTFENPKMYAIEMQKLEVEKMKALASHQGTLVLGNNSGVQMQIPNK